MKMPMDLTEVKLRRKDVFEGKIMTAVSYTHLTLPTIA